MSQQAGPPCERCGAPTVPAVVEQVSRGLRPGRILARRQVIKVWRCTARGKIHDTIRP